MRRVEDHSHVVRLIEVYESDRSVHLVLELVRGQELFEAVKAREGAKCFEEREA